MQSQLVKKAAIWAAVSAVGFGTGWVAMDMARMVNFDLAREVRTTCNGETTVERDEYHWGRRPPKTPLSIDKSDLDQSQSK